MNTKTGLSEELDLRRRKLRFRAWHRGTREMDIVLGRFADMAVTSLNEAEIAELEALMEVPDPDLFAWIAGQKAVPPNYDTPVFRCIRSFHQKGKGLPPR